MITHVRIDERLAHGQVCVKWVSAVKAQTLIVLDDGTAHDPFLKKVTQGVAPRGIKLEVMAADDIPAIIRTYNGTGPNAMIVTKVPGYVLKLVEAGATDIKTVTVGNMGGNAKRKKITNHAWISEDERAEFRKLMDLGVGLETRQVPNDNPADFGKLIGG